MPDWIDTLVKGTVSPNTRRFPCPCCKCGQGTTKVIPCKVVVSEFSPRLQKTATLYFCTCCEHKTVEVGID